MLHHSSEITAINHLGCAPWSTASPGPRYTIGIEEELMILDAEIARARRTRSRRCSRPCRRRGRGQARADGVRARDRHRPRARTSPRPASSCASCAARSPRRPPRKGLAIGSAGTHPFAMWEDQRIVARPRYRDLIAALRFVARQELIFGVHVHVGHRRPRQGDPRGQRDAGARAAAARRCRPTRRSGAPTPPAWPRPGRRSSARFPRVGIPPTLRGLGGLRAPDRVHGRAARDRGLHLPLVRRPAAPATSARSRCG